MAIIATLMKAEEYKTHWKMEVEYNDEGDVTVETFRFNGTTVAKLIDYVKAKATQQEDIKSFDFSTIVGSSVDLTPDEVIPLTQAEIDENTWFADWNQYQKTINVLEKLPLLATAGRIAFRDGLQVSLEATWKDSYLGKT